VGHVEVQQFSRLVDDQKDVRRLDALYGIIRAQALSPAFPAAVHVRDSKDPEGGSGNRPALHRCHASSGGVGSFLDPVLMGGGRG
jgi:hypothetical protein